MPDDQAVAEAPSRKVTVLILSYNCLGALRRCVQSVEASAGRELVEILVVDKGSQDGSSQIDGENPRVTVLRLPRNFGQTKALNIGVRTALGEFVLILAPDFDVAPDTIETLRGYLEGHSDTIAVIPVPHAEDGHVQSPIRPLATREILWDAWKQGRPLPVRLLPEGEEAAPAEAFEDAPILVRRQFIRGMNFFDERYGEYGWEPELSWQIRGAVKRLMVLPGARVTFHADSRPGLTASARAQVEADRALGMAAFLGKHSGMQAEIKFRLKASLVALGRALGALFRAREVGYHFSLLSALVSGQRIDGSQSSL
ncbi:MAG: glycosyltransferase [Acidobacteria bacterium]|nr:glycosyltransferase [Acidobacteriota bacterium]